MFKITVSVVNENNNDTNLAKTRLKMKGFVTASFRI